MKYLPPTRNVVFILLSWTWVTRNLCSAFLSVRTLRGHHAALSSFRLGQRPTARLLTRYYTNSTVSDEDRRVLERFQREAAKKKEIDEECILTIHGNQYNMTAWANAHPGKDNNLSCRSRGQGLAKTFLTDCFIQAEPRFYSSLIIEMPPRRLKGPTTPRTPTPC